MHARQADAEEYIVAGRVNFLGTHRFELSCIFRKKKPAKHGSAGSALSWPITSLNAIARTQRTFSCRSRLSPHRHPRIGCVPPWQSNSAHASGYRTDGERYCRKSDFSWLGRKLEANRNVPLRLVAIEARRDLYRRLAQASVDIKPT